MKEFFQDSSVIIIILASVLCLLLSILYCLAFNTMRERIALQERLIELKDEQMEVLKQQIDEQNKIIKEYEEINDLMIDNISAVKRMEKLKESKGINDGTK